MTHDGCHVLEAKPWKTKSLQQIFYYFRGPQLSAYKTMIYLFGYMCTFYLSWKIHEQNPCWITSMSGSEVTRWLSTYHFLSHGCLLQLEEGLQRKTTQCTNSFFQVKVLHVSMLKHLKVIPHGTYACVQMKSECYLRRKSEVCITLTGCVPRGYCRLLIRFGSMIQTQTMMCSENVLSGAVRVEQATMRVKEQKFIRYTNKQVNRTKFDYCDFVDLWYFSPGVSKQGKST